MNIGIIGSGMVGKALAEGFAKRGDSVVIGSRSPEKLLDWCKETAPAVHLGSFEEAAVHGEIIALATKWDGDAARKALDLAGQDNLAGKILMDITNPLIVREENAPPELAVSFPESAGKLVQKWLPDTRVVKIFNTITSAYMANPRLEEGTPDMFLCGNDSEAKEIVTAIATGWGWPVRDLGDISQAYLLEALALIWIRFGFLNNHWTHAFKLLMR